MIYGTDAGVYPNGDNARQFATMVAWGMTPLQALRSAATHRGRGAGAHQGRGDIAVGRYGDLIAVAGNPLEDVAVSQNVRFVMKGGAVAKN